MGAKSTVEISQQDARIEIVKSLIYASNKELERILDELFGDRFLYDFHVVNNYINQNDPYIYKPGMLD